MRQSGAMLDELSKCTKMFFLTQHDTRILSNSWIHLMLATLARRCPAVFKTIHVVYTKMDSLILGSLDRDIDTVKSHFVDAVSRIAFARMPRRFTRYRRRQKSSRADGKIAFA